MNIFSVASQYKIKLAQLNIDMLRTMLMDLVNYARDAERLTNKKDKTSIKLLPEAEADLQNQIQKIIQYIPQIPLNKIKIILGHLVVSARSTEETQFKKDKTSVKLRPEYEENLKRHIEEIIEEFSQINDNYDHSKLLTKLNLNSDNYERIKLGYEELVEKLEKTLSSSIEIYKTFEDMLSISGEYKIETEKRLFEIGAFITKIKNMRNNLYERYSPE